MIAFLIANWKSLAASAATFLICLTLHRLDVHFINLQHEKDIAEVKQAMTKECAKAQAITEKVSHDYQKSIASLSSRLAAAHRMHDSECVAVEGYTTGRHDDAAKLGKPSRSPSEQARKLSAGYLIDLTGEGEKYRLQLLACQAFVTATEEVR